MRYLFLTFALMAIGLFQFTDYHTASDAIADFKIPALQDW